MQKQKQNGTIKMKKEKTTNYYCKKCEDFYMEFEIDLDLSDHFGYVCKHCSNEIFFETLNDAYRGWNI